MYAIIGTWKMCYDGLSAGHALLSAGGASSRGVVFRAAVSQRQAAGPLR